MTDEERIVQLETTLEMVYVRLRLMADGGKLSHDTLLTMLKQIQRVLEAGGA